jgi:virginiamycin B lyase
MAQAQARRFPIRNGSAPFDITQGTDGNFWFTLSNSSKVARITPRGQISYLRKPSPSNPAFITLGPDSNLWFGEGSTGRIASVTPAGVVTEFQFSFFAVSVGTTTGADGKIWFSDQTDHAIWRFDLGTGTFTEFNTRHRIRFRAT